MKANIQTQTDELLIINWVEEAKGFGQLTLKWDWETQEYILDSELMGIDTVIKIFKALK